MDREAHGCALRKGRVSLDNQIYHVTAVTYSRQSFFADFLTGRILVREIMRTVGYGCTDTLAFVVMPDHVHWLFSLTASQSLSSVVGAVKRHSAREINKQHHSHSNTIWQRGCHDHALRSDESVLHVARYIVANPLRAGLVNNIGDYPLWDATWLHT